MPHQHRLLLVEDDTDSRDALRELLEIDGFAVVAVRGGGEAIDNLRQGYRPCLILLDLHLPDMTGWDFRRVQQTDPDYRDIPLALLSGSPDLGEHAHRMGVDIYLTKPTDPARLSQLVTRYCEQREARA